MSIPTSLIVVVLVLAWLMVLVPMVARRREAVPEAEMAGGTFRVLRRSGEGARRRPVFRRRSDGEADEVAEQPAAEEFSDDEDLDQELLDDDYDDSADYDSDEYDSDEYDSDDEVDEHYGYQAAGARVDAPTQVAATAAPVPTAGPGRRSTGSHPYRQDERPSGGSHPYRPAALRDPAAPAAPAATQPDQQRYEAAPPEQHDDDVHLRPIPRRAGRGGYDPDAAEVARRYKYSRRRRVAVVLLLAAVLFSVAAVLLRPVLWAGTAVFGLLLVGYLAYLRRQVRIEADIRERRLARLRRARQIRPEYDLDRGESASSGADFVNGGVPASQVPPTGYRRGREIVDLDDDDPAFDDLEYHQPLTYRRASGQ